MTIYKLNVPQIPGEKACFGCMLDGFHGVSIRGFSYPRTMNSFPKSCIADADNDIPRALLKWSDVQVTGITYVAVAANGHACMHACICSACRLPANTVGNVDIN